MNIKITALLAAFIILVEVLAGGVSNTLNIPMNFVIIFMVVVQFSVLIGIGLTAKRWMVSMLLFCVAVSFIQSLVSLGMYFYMTESTVKSTLITLATGIIQVVAPTIIAILIISKTKRIKSRLDKREYNATRPE